MVESAEGGKEDYEEVDDDASHWTHFANGCGSTWGWGVVYWLWGGAQRDMKEVWREGRGD